MAVLPVSVYMVRARINDKGRPARSWGRWFSMSQMCGIVVSNARVWAHDQGLPWVGKIVTPRGWGVCSSAWETLQQFAHIEKPHAVLASLASDSIFLKQLEIKFLRPS